MNEEKGLPDLLGIKRYMIGLLKRELKNTLK